jgi:hypothetical protein
MVVGSSRFARLAALVSDAWQFSFVQEKTLGTAPGFSSFLSRVNEPVDKTKEKEKMNKNNINQYKIMISYKCEIKHKDVIRNMSHQLS